MNLVTACPRLSWWLYVGHLVCAGFLFSRSVNPRTAATLLFDSTDLDLADQQEVPTLLTALHYLSGMTKALAQDVNHGLMVHTLGKLPSQS